jgi:hypothetical protein
MASGAPGAMDSLKGRISKSGRKRKNKGTASRIQQFYDEFNSSPSSPESESDDDQKGTFFGYKNRPRAPMIRPVPAGRPTSIEIPRESNSTPSDSGSVTSPKFHFSEPPMSPGLTPNQDIKDSALNVIFQKRIRTLKSISSVASVFIMQQYLPNRPVGLFICPLIYVSVNPSISSFLRPSIHPSICLSVRRWVCPRNSYRRERLSTIDLLILTC